MSAYKQRGSPRGHDLAFIRFFLINVRGMKYLVLFIFEPAINAASLQSLVRLPGEHAVNEPGWNLLRRGGRPKINSAS
jgi:hypothetical protein